MSFCDRDGDGSVSMEEARFAKETKDREDKRTGAGLQPGGPPTGEDERIRATASADEIDEVYQAIEEVSQSLSKRIL